MPKADSIPVLSNPIGRYPGHAPAATAKPKLLNRLREALRSRHYSRRTEQTYCHWVKRFILFDTKRQPADMAEQGINAFLTHVDCHTFRYSFATQLPRRRLRYPDGPRASRGRRCENDDDLCPCFESGREGCSKSHGFSMSTGWVWSIMRKPYKTPECCSRWEIILIIPAVTYKMTLASYADKTPTMGSYPETIKYIARSPPSSYE